MRDLPRRNDRNEEITSIEQVRTQANVQQHAGSMAEIERAVQEVQAALVIAKRFPRDEQASYARIIKACKRPSLAEVALYEYTKGGSEVSGPSIRLAEELARDWGNIAFGWRVLYQDDEKSEVRVEAWDLETNVPSFTVFTVPHYIRTKNGSKYLSDPRDIYEHIANQASRRLRSCILRVIPGDVQDAAVEQCERTLREGGGKPLADRVRDMLVAFEHDHNVTKAMIEKRLGHKAEAISETELVQLRRIYVSLRDGIAKVEQFFQPEDAPTAESLQRTPEKKKREEAGHQDSQHHEGLFTVLDALALVYRGKIEEALDISRHMSAADRKKVAEAIEARKKAEQGDSAEAVSESPAEEENEQPSEDRKIDLSDVLEELREANSELELQAVGTLITDLNPDDQVVARAKWMERKAQLAKKGARGLE